MAERPETLPEIEAACWRELAAAAPDRTHGWHVPVLATVDADRADARTVVLREVDADARVLRFFSDSRSAKVRQIASNPRGTMVFWCPSLHWQLRAGVTLEAETGGLAVTSRWAQVKLRPAMLDYLSPLPPGTPLEREDEPARARRGLGHFAVVSARIESLDWLELKPDGHRGARFDATGAHWVQA